MTLFILLLFAQPTVSLVGSDLEPAEALSQLTKQTGVRIVLDLGRPSSRLSLDLRGASTWHALDEIARQLNARLELQRSAVRLVARAGDAPAALTSYSGPFRVRPVRTLTTRDLVSGTGTCTVTLEVGWLPTLRPIFLDSSPHDLQIVDRRGKPVPPPEGTGTLVPVEGRPSLLLDVALPALPREDAHIEKFAGKLNAIVLGEMITFDLDANLEALRFAPATGAQRRLTRSGVTCSVLDVRLGRDRWTVKLALDYPEGANRDLESFQAGSMVVANELRLVGKDGKHQLVPNASVTEETGPRRTVVSFHFIDGPTGKRGTPSTWKVRYRAPSRILDQTLSFSFDKVPLP